VSTALPCHKHYLAEHAQAFYIDQHTIEAAHPMQMNRTELQQGAYAAWDVALILVGERHAKHDLVDLVGYLLHATMRMNETLRRQAAAATMGMDAAKRTSTFQLELAEQARAESSPEALASERAANAILTEENARLQVEADRYRFIRNDEYWQQSDRYWEALTAGGEKLDNTVDDGIKSRAESQVEEL
jgi:hypothetical protein